MIASDVLRRGCGASTGALQLEPIAVLDRENGARQVPEQRAVDPARRRSRSVENARAISSGLTASAPSPMARKLSSGLWMPSRCAMRTTFFGPSCAVSCA